MRPVTLDYETFYIKNEYSVKDLGNWRYTHDERFDPYLLSVYDGEQSWVGNPADFNWAALEGALLLAHNAGFDSSVTERLGELGKIPVITNPWACTANMTSCLFSSRSLADAMWVARKQRISKGVRDDMNKKNWAGIKAAGMADAVVKYALADSVECFNLWRDYSRRWSPFEQRLSDLTIKQCRRGVKINVELLEEYRHVLQEVIFNLVKSFPWTKEGKKPTSPIAIAEECRKHGIPGPPVKTRDEEGFELWEKTYGPRFSWVYGAGQWRSLNKLLGSLDTVKERLRPDGTIDFSLLYFGGHTGRWSGGGSGFNLQNLRKEPLFLKDRCMVMVPDEARVSKAAFKQWKQECTDYALDIRKLFVPREGKKFILCDLAQVEPRVLNWLAGNTQLLDAIKQGYSYYEACARLYEGWTGAPGTIKTSLSDKDYTLLKNKMLGLGYGMGAERFCEYASVDMDTAEKAVADFRANNPLVVDLWHNLDNNFRQSCGGDFTMELPSGRQMVYRDVLREIRTKRNKEKKLEKRFVWTALTGPDRYESYGGLLTENVVQACARDAFGEHLLELEETTGDVIWHVHDEAITEVEQDVTPKDVEAVMSKTPEWLPGCPLAAEAKEAPHYLK
jgi:hypothetical protein